MDKINSVFLEYGLLGALVVVAGIIIFRLYAKVNELQNQLVENKDLEIQRKDKDNEQYIGMLEKTLNALTTIEKSIFENSANLPQKLFESIQKGNEPLMAEIRLFLNRCKNG